MPHDQVALRRFDAVLTRASVRGNTLYGYASVFGQVAEVAEGVEGLDPTAFDAVLDDAGTDVRALWNHDPTLLLGRQGAGTLRVSVDADGLGYECDLPNTSYAQDLRELVSRGDLTGASFGFVPGTARLERADGRTIRWHTSVRALVDVSPVTFPAYSGAGTQLRGRQHLPAAAAARSAGLRGQTALLRHRARQEPRP